MFLSLFCSESMMVSVQAFATEMGNRWAVWWVCQLEHWQFYLDCFNVNTIFSDFNTLGLSLFFLLVYTNLSNSCYYLFPPQPEDNRDFYIYPQDILHSFQEVMVRNFPSATILFVSPLQGSRVSVLYHKKMCISKQSPWAIFILTIKVKSHA